jgi:hypothetical protein
LAVDVLEGELRRREIDLQGYDGRLTGCPAIRLGGSQKYHGKTDEQ